MPRAESPRDYVVLVAPLPSSFAETDRESDGGLGAIILTHDPEQRPRSAADVLQYGLGLPRAAAKLVAALAADDDLKSYADREGVTIHTVRFHLRTDFF